jgi:type I restriction enzyme, R subunit
MTELGYVEKPMLDWLKGMGWTYRTDEQMEAFGRALTDPIVEKLLIPAIRRINPTVADDAQARRVVEQFRRVLNLPDPLEANQKTLAALRDGISVVLAAGQDAVTVKLIEFDRAKLTLNDFTATNQYSVRGTETCRADTVLLVNGIPVVVAEYKSFINSGKDWKEGVNQLHRYQREAPGLLVPNVFCVAADEQEFRYGPVAFKINSQQDINAQRDHWRPWLSQYPTKRMYWTQPDDQLDTDPVRAATHGLLLPCNVVDFIENFSVFETKKGKTIKKVARYQQFEAANDIVDRVLEGQYKTGLIWHTQGSGKSLTMIFAGYKLRRQTKLKNPTVMIVVDRRDLKTQIGDDFENCDYPNVDKAMGVRDLKDRIKKNYQGTVVTTIQCFQQMDDLEPSPRDNVILLIDESHRSQKGKGAGFAMTMRAKLPKAFRFGMTGTPIDRTMVNTHRDFGPVIDGEQERYLSYYGIRQSIRDGATLEVYYEPHYVPIAVEDQPLSVGFEDMCEEVELDDEEEKDFLQRKEAQWKKLVRDERRVQKVIEHLVDHFLKHPDPSGFKAQLVTIDRQACAIYKKLLEAELKKRGLPPEWSDVVISEAQNDPPELERYHYGIEKTEKLIEKFKLTPEQWAAANKKKFGDDKTKWEPPLKILIVCDKLLTGFDAPVEQVMYLDKPLRDHNLLQAMARTNRPFPEMGKKCGLIIDYFGVFNDLEKALNFDEKVREEALIDWQKLKEQVPIEVAKCMAFFHGIKIEDTRDCLLACLRRLADPKNTTEFEAQFKRTETLWEAISPDECLYPMRYQYAWLCGMYVAHRRRNRRVLASHEELAAKTRELIQQNTSFMDMAEDVPVYRIDDKYLTRVQELPTAADRAAELESALNRELIEGGGKGFLYRSLGERLLRVVQQKETTDDAALKRIREYEAIVQELNKAKSEPGRLGLTEPGEFDLFTVVQDFAKVKDEALCVKATKAMMAQLKQSKLLPAGWAESAGGRKKVSLSLQVISLGDEFLPLGLCSEDDADPVFVRMAVDELARTT